MKDGLASLAPALQTGTAVATGSSFLLAHPTTGLVVPDGAGSSVSSRETVGIGFLGAQDEDGHHSQEEVQELDLHDVGFESECCCRNNSNLIFESKPPATALYRDRDLSASFVVFLELIGR